MRTWLLVLVAAVIAAAQEPIRVTSRLIEMNVIVQDHNGPIADLTAKSFKLFDNEKEQRIAVFRVSGVVGPATQSVPPLPPGVFSNRHRVTLERAPRPTILLIDTLNTGLPDQAYVKSQLLAMLESNQINDPTAVYVLGQKFRVLQELTTDASLLMRAVESFHPEGSAKLRMALTPSPSMPGGSGKSAEMARQSFEEIRAFGNRDRALATIDMFEQLGKRLAGIPGRKSVIWISNAFPATSLRGDTEIMRRLNRTDVAIYAVHARGLEFALHTPESDVMQWAAEETGGRAYFSRNDIGVAIHEAIEDANVTCTLGFYAAHDAPSGTFHTLKVAVDRPGVEVRHRAGYLDAESKPDTRPAAVSESANDIGLIAAIASGATEYKLAVHVDFKDMRLEQVDGKWKGSAELGVVSQNASGKTLDLANKKLTFDMTDEAYQARQREGFAIEQVISRSADTAMIRVVIVDQSGTSGSVTITPPKL